MFHWICPECGREIAPQVMECPSCDPAPVEAAPQPVLLPELPPQTPIRFELAPEPLLLAAPAPKPEPDPAPLQPRLSGAPRPPAPARPTPVQLAGRDLAPIQGVPTMLARTVAGTPTLPTLEPATAPQITQAPLRAPEAARPPASLSAIPNIAAGPEPAAIPPALLAPDPAPAPAPVAGKLIPYASQTLASLKPSAPKSHRTLAPPHEQLSLPGPTLPHELTSLDAAGIARILVAGAAQSAPRRSSWFVSLMVASAILAASLGAVFYAVPTLAGTAAPPAPVATKEAKPAPPPVPAIPENPLARRIEVTGIRFVTDIPGQRPEIHYLVVNHSNEVLSNVSVNVTLRSLDSGPDGAPLSRFSFLAPRLRAYESKEMASSIERINRPVSLPDWRHLRADIEVVQR